MKHYNHFFNLLIESCLNVSHSLEVCLSSGVVERCVLDFILFGEVVQGLNRSVQPGHREEGSQVGSVGRDDNETEQPPRRSN